MKITHLSCHVLLAPDMDISSTSSAQDSFVVTIRTDEGIEGVGESDINPWIARACVDAPGTHTMGQGIRQTLLGADPLSIEDLWQQLYIGTAMNGRRGALIHALGAIEMALWDIKGKALGKPIFELLGGAQQQRVVPYASLQPDGNSWEEYRDSLCAWAERAKGLGFHAVKAEVTMNGPFAHHGMREDYDKHTCVVEAVRKVLGPEIALMVDVQYMWSDAETAIRTVKDWSEFDIFFLETPIWIDRVQEYARLRRLSDIRIAAGEWQATRFEFQEFLDQDALDVLQPDVGRVGGFGEAMAVCEMARRHNKLIVPHCWKTGISVTATAHLAFANSNCRFIEYLPPELCTSTLRKELASDGFSFVDGFLQQPTKPGLGVDLNQDALQRFRVV